MDLLKIVDHEDHTSSSTTSSESGDSDLVIPTEFICPLTLEVMTDPVVSKYGKSFERDAILEWLGKGHGSCPLTRQPMKLSDIITDHRLRARIHAWRKANNVDIHLFLSSRSSENIIGFITLDSSDDFAERSEDDPFPLRESSLPAPVQVPARRPRRSTRSSSSSRRSHTRTQEDRRSRGFLRFFRSLQI